MVQCLIGLGSNLSDRELALVSAWQLLGELPETNALQISRFFATPPAGGPAGQEVFSNAVGLIETRLSPETILRELLATEAALGRVRKERWGPRAIDLDLLLHGDTILQTPSLTLPHPRMAFRRFVLEPAVDVAPEMVYPLNGWTIKRLLDHLNSTAPIIAIAGLDEELCEASLRAIAERNGDVEIHRDRAAALSQLSGADRWHLLTTWPQEEPSDALSGATQPKLVVILDPLNANTAVAETRRQRLQQRIRDPDVGPTLWLETGDAQAVADEVIAAMTAMR